MLTSFDSSVELLLGGTSFHQALDKRQVDRLRCDIQAKPVNAGTTVASRGSPADAWLGVASGLVRIENNEADGRHTTLTYFSAGCWFGEGTLLKRGLWPFDAVAVTDSVVAFVPISTFELLLDSSIAFNRFLLDQTNARLAQLVERCVHFRLHDVEQHVVHCLNEMVDPRLCLNSGNCISISQDGLAHLAGVSRSVVNRVLHKLENQGLVQVDYRSITLLNQAELRRFSAAIR